MAGVERKGTFKVEFLKEIERSAQQKWDQLKIFEVDAPEAVRSSPGSLKPRLVYVCNVTDPPSENDVFPPFHDTCVISFSCTFKKNHFCVNFTILSVFS
jgi:hypothetical protein